MNEFEQFLVENGIDDTEALNAVVQAQPTGKDVQSAWRIANMEKDWSPAARDTLPRPYPEDYSKDRQLNRVGQIMDGIVNMGADAIRNPFSTATTVLAMDPKMYAGMKLLPAFAKGAGIEESGGYIDEGIRQAGRLGADLVQNPGDINHLLRGAGMEIAKLPSLAAKHGRALWNNMSKDFKNPKPFESMDQNEFNDIHKTFEPMRP